MIFYGKARSRVAVADAVRAVDEAVAAALAPGLSIERHAAWVEALVEAGGLAQGLADADECAAGAAAAIALCVALAGLMGRSWDSAFADLPDALPAPAAAALAALRGAPGLPEAVEVRRTEGFSHYALYPEASWDAAKGLGEPRPARVLGLRSIGLTLGAAAAAALDAPPPRTARPRGHPFARTVDLTPPLDDGDRAAAWAVVDEGPGLSGSSMGAAADALAAAGVARDRVALLPGHAGPPGPMASAAYRRLWAEVRVAAVPFEALMLGDGPRGLGTWMEDIAGPPLAPPEDVAGGAWREHVYPDEAEWPAADRQNERRKYLLRGARATVLLRFAGLGAFGRAKLARARALGAAGFGVAPLALRHGFLVEPWRADLQPARPRRAGEPAPLGRIAGYIAFRARAFPARPGDGAPLDALLDMARANAAELLGAGAAARLDGWAARLPALARAAHPVMIDGCLAPHEWLGDGRGPLLKADALDGCCGHDLVGCQDAAWDVAGAGAEWGLDAVEVEALRRAVERGAGRPCDPALVAFFAIAYPAFRAGALAIAGARETGAEGARIALARDRQAAALRRALG